MIQHTIENHFLKTCKLVRAVKLFVETHLDIDMFINRQKNKINFEPAEPTYAKSFWLLKNPEYFT